MLKRMIPAMLVAAVLAGAPTPGRAEGINVDFPANLSERDKEVMTGALQILMLKCPDLPKYWDQLSGGTAAFLPSFVAENSGLKKARGWGRMVELTATVKGDAKLPKGWDGWNHTLSWRMGGGEKPGIFIVKPQAARFCGKTGSDVSIDAPLQFID
ncbi:exported hypothetical protein [uncultured Alphaproteobacteria bacterium]|uniref:Secreted protein n=1 Tax=uncultured Alphaproteobacteria bacterium TaxID=91750 RepID=A0A212KMZ9_9PROT|nr:exported hypothetical protein [uncultured Alphaproteobacteria bacterium]